MTEDARPGLAARFRDLLVGKPRDPLKAATRQDVALAAFLAWVGLGADGLSSSCYGPEEAFLALGAHSQLGLYLAVATALTVFLISLAYNQVIELFPSGGGGYKVATRLLGPHAGLVSGAALLVDYVLTIAISVASGVDALGSLVPVTFHDWKLTVEVGLVGFLLLLHLRGMRESILVLLPLFLGFFITHVALIVYGVVAHAEGLPAEVEQAVDETFSLAGQTGWVFVAALCLKAYSMGGGTYTGLEAVSNNVHILAEPRVRTGRLTMFYMALSLSFVAGGIILLYLLWDAAPAAGQTLNAVVFRAIIDSFHVEQPFYETGALALVLALEAGLLLVAANTGFLGGPPVLANMAADSWVPRQLRSLSHRLVTQNGLVFMGLAAGLVLMATEGDVSVLVVLYSINVFLTFTLSLAGLTRHWLRNRRDVPDWKPRLALSFTGFAVCAGILVVTLTLKFAEGGWITVLITGGVIAVCLAIRRHYDETREQLRRIDEIFATQKLPYEVESPPRADASSPTAVFLVGKNLGVAMHGILWVQRLFPGRFNNFVFLAAGEVDAQSYDGPGALRTMQYRVDNSLKSLVAFCHANGLAASSRCAFGTDPVDQLFRLTAQVMRDFPDSVCFASKLIFVHDNWFTSLLHNQTALAMQRKLHLEGLQMVILPMKV